MGSRIVLAVVAMVLATACSSSTAPGGGGGGGGGSSTTITASSQTTGGGYGSGGNYFFNPNPDSVATGSTVTFQFGSVTHNVQFTSGPSLPANIPNSTNTTVNRTFSTAGTYGFKCTIHGFTGSLVVH